MKNNSVRRVRQAGNAMVEFALIGVPLIFLLLITFEVARAVWAYHTLAHAVKEGARYAIVRGNDCAVVPNNCAGTKAAVAQRIRTAGIGLIPADFQIAFGASASFANISTYTADQSRFPSSGTGARFLPLTIRGQYSFYSPLGKLLTAGLGPDHYTFVANSRELIQY